MNTPWKSGSGGIHLVPVAAVSTAPGSVEPTTAPLPDDNSVMVLWIWAIVGLSAAYAFGAFRSRSIVGPERIAPGQSAWDLIIVLFLSFLMTVLAVGTVSRVHLGPDSKLLVLNGAANALSCLAIILLLKFFHPGQLTRLGTDPRWIFAGMAGGAATLFVLYPLISLSGVAVGFFYSRLHLSKPGPHELLQLLGDTRNRGIIIGTIVLASIGAPLTEELMYRGLLQTALGTAFATLWTQVNGSNSLGAAEEIRSVESPQAFHRWAAVVLTAGIFAAVHMNLAFFVPIFILALGLGYVYERTGNLWVSILRMDYSMADKFCISCSGIVNPNESTSPAF